MNTDSEGRYLTQLETENARLTRENAKLTALVEEIYRVFSCPTATGEWIKHHLEWIRIDLAKILPKKVITGAKAVFKVNGETVGFATNVRYSRVHDGEIHVLGTPELADPKKKKPQSED